MIGKVKGLRLQEKLWEKIDKCAEKSGMNRNSFCALMLETVCDELLKKADNDGDES